MAGFLGNQPSQVPLTSADIADGTITNDDLAGSITDAKISALSASKLTGSLPASMATDLAPVRSDILKLAIHSGIDGNRAAFNLDDSFIDTFEDDTGITTETTVDRNVSGEYVNTLTSVALDTATNIAPSSNDWDTSLGIFNFSGNTLGDHTIGGNVHAVQAKENFSSLITLDGDFIISFTMEDSDDMTFGVYGIESDSDRTNTDTSGMYYMSASNTSFWWGIGYSSGASARINSSAEGSFTAPANGSAMIIRRVSGTITLEDDGVVIHTYSVTYSNPMRFAGGSDTNGLDASLKNLVFTDTDKIQRDGHIHEAINSGIGFGDAVSSSKHVGQLWTPTRSGNVTGFKIDIQTVSAALTCHVEIWTHDGTNPAAQVGGDSDSLSLSVAILSGTFSGTLPTVKKGTRYWVIFVDEGTSGNAVIRQVATAYGTDTGRNDTLASMTDGGLTALKIEVQVDTSAGEPTPDHDTHFLCAQTTQADGNTTFTDVMGNVSLVAVNDTQWDTAQTKFGSSSILFDGTGDELTIAHSATIQAIFEGDFFTYDCWFRTGSAAGIDIFNKEGSGSYDALRFNLNGNYLRILMSNNLSSWPINTTGSINVIDSAWHHAALVVMRDKWNVYVDGVLDFTATSALRPNASTSYPWRIGGGGTSADFNGHIQMPRLSTVARWDANFTPPTAAYLTTTSTTSSIGATGTLISDTQTASTSRTTASGVMIYEDGAGTSTLGTHLKIYFTANNGTNWTEASSYGTATTYSGTKKLVKLGSTTVTAGTQVAMKAVWASQSASKEARLHGWAVNY